MKCKLLSYPKNLTEIFLWKKERIFYTGEDIGIYARAVFDECEPSGSLDDYEIEVKVSTTPLGKTFMATTAANGGVMRKEDNIFGFNIPSEVTTAMSPGHLIISIALTHTATGARKIVEDSSLLLRESKIN